MYSEKPDGSFNFTACPKLNTQVLFESGFKPEDRFQIINRIAVYPSEYFCPKNYQTGKLKCTVHTYSIHHYRGTWLPLKLKIKLLILHMLGERGRKIYEGWKKHFLEREYFYDKDMVRDSHVSVAGNCFDQLAAIILKNTTDWIEDYDYIGLKIFQFMCCLIKRGIL